MHNVEEAIKVLLIVDAGGPEKVQLYRRISE
jgi:hypothetical protein